MIAHNSGYNVSTRGSRSQLTVLTNGNQLSMEHRYFAPSRPDPADWSKLTIEQAAGDQHRITQALKARIYRGKWLTTGASKGGMTSLFHRRFFPDDVDGTVAYVAPIDYPEDAVQSPTNRYIVFLENVGTDPACRQKLKDFQNTVLARREAMKTRMRSEAAFTILGEDRALDFAVVEMPFIFWQYGNQSRCASIPGAAATDAAVFGFLDDTAGVASYGDDSLTGFLAYYHQSATQLGYPAADESYLVGLQHPGEDTARAYIPAAIPTPAYDQGAAMRDVQTWIAASGERIMLIYGQNDPWTAGAVDLGAATDSYRYIAPNGNHGASITSLTDQEESDARETVLRWAGLPSSGAMARVRLHTGERTLEQEELELRRPR
ncbi:MAG: aminopeptidase [Kofleriaceae bacterium]|nr:MAG: aminopeptidase [Kofleriaceae bacterium]